MSSIQSPGPLPIGVSDFGELIRQNYTFVDKSHLIKDIIEYGAKVTLITRPRRFGKTLNLSMLHHFFAGEVFGQPTDRLFDKLEIGKDSACLGHQGQYPVIFFTFKDIKESRYDDVIDKLRASMARLYQGYPELPDSPHLTEEQKADIADIRAKKSGLTALSEAFKNLSEYLYRHHQKPVVMLIDEYDTPIHAAFVEGYYQELVKFMRGLLGGGLKDNSFLYKAVVTGILRISRESLFSGVNNLELYTVLEQGYSQYFGFTEAEVKGLLSDFGAEEQGAAIQTWYNGYQFGEHVIYNPWSIVNCLKQRGQMRPYWINTSDNALLKELMARADEYVKQPIEQLLQGQSVEQLVDPNIVFGDLEKDGMALWSLLLFSGYLTASDPQYDMEGRVTCQLRIPNREVLGLYQRHIKEWFTDAMGLQGYSDFLRCLVSGRLAEFKARLTDYLMESASYFDEGERHPEKFYHGLVLGLIAGLKETHLIYSNRESGFGRYDIAVLPRETAPADQRLGILMEFKAVKGKESLEDSARAALQQIEDQRYQTELERHRIEKVLKIGLAFSGKEVAIEHAI